MDKSQPLKLYDNLLEKHLLLEVIDNKYYVTYEDAEKREASNYEVVEAFYEGEWEPAERVEETYTK